jgi:hypothetical protein
MRMFGPRGNPNARNLLKVIGCIQQRERARIKIHPNR